VKYPSTTMFYTTTGFPLEAEISPDNATNQAISWAITKWEPGTAAQGNTDASAVTLDLSKPLTDPETDPDKKDDFAYTKKLLLKRVNWLQEEYVVDESVYPAEKDLRNVLGILTAPGKADSIGKATVRVVIKDGYYEPKTGTFSNYTQSLVINIINPPEFYYKLSSADTTTNTRNYGAVDNFGIAKGGKMEVVNSALAVVTDKGSAYKSTFGPGGSYANSSHYFEVKLGTGNKLENFSAVKLKFWSSDFTLHGKSFRMKAMETPPPNKGYAPGAYVSTTSFSSTDNPDANGWWDIELKLFEDNATNADGTSKKGIYDKGVGKDLRLSTTDGANATAYGKLKDEDTIYVWFLPWCGDKMTFIISDVEFIPKQP